MMRELDTVSPVVWPAWCYSGEGQGDVETPGEQTTPPAPRPRGKQRRGALTSVAAAMNGGDLPVSNNSSTTTSGGSPPVKTERLSPSSASAAPADNNSSSSRSATPSSSYPGTPPGGGGGGGGAASDRAASPHLKHMEQMMTRNYSDFMRSLAAKYNNANPNDYFSGASAGRNGYLDPRFASFKTGATPFVGLMAPLTTPTPLKNSMTPATPSVVCKEEAKKPPSAGDLLGMFPPMIDMSSTQALLSMVRTANAHSASQLETYLKGATKRPQPPPETTSPLDLSPGAVAPPPAKRAPRHSKSLGESLFASSKASVEAAAAGRRRLGSVSPKPRPCARALPCLSACGGTSGAATCAPDAHALAHWGVEDVAGFVAGIDICSEYAQNFRDQRIDGAALPLLTEEHLTGTLGMRLGPALKLRATLARRLGQCAVCMHCSHCHASPPAAAPSPAVSRPSSTGV